MNGNTKKVLSRLQAQCAKREYCSQDITEKALKALDGDREEAAEVLESLISDGYVSDMRYAGAFAREKASLTGWGPVKIRYALAARHIPRETIGGALAGIEDDKAGARLRTILEARWKTLKDDPQGKLKLIRFALGRGYEYDGIRDAVEELTRN